MLSATECRSRAVEWERRCLDCKDDALRREIAMVARTWRYLARQAAWQDVYLVDGL